MCTYASYRLLGERDRTREREETPVEGLLEGPELEGELQE